MTAQGLKNFMVNPLIKVATTSDRTWENFPILSSQGLIQLKSDVILLNDILEVVKIRWYSGSGKDKMYHFVFLSWRNLIGALYLSFESAFSISFSFIFTSSEGL